MGLKADPTWISKAKLNAVPFIFSNSAAIGFLNQEDCSEYCEINIVLNLRCCLKTMIKALSQCTCSAVLADL